MTLQRFNSIATVLAMILLLGCNNSSKLAQQHFQRAEKLFLSQQYNTAKLELDTIIDRYPDNVEISTRTKDLLFKIKITEQQNNIQFLDSIISIKQSALLPLMQNFEPTNDGSKTLLVHKRQKNINYYGRTYLRPILDSIGNFHISSYYCGESYIHHQQINVTAGNESATSEIIEKDDFNNRQFNDGGLYWEVVQYKAGKDNGVIDFIAQHADQTIKVQFMGKRNAVAWMESADKESIRDGYEISFLLKEISTLLKEKENAHAELKRLGAQQNDK